MRKNKLTREEMRTQKLMLYDKVRAGELTIGQAFVAAYPQTSLRCSDDSQGRATRSRSPADELVMSKLVESRFLQLGIPGHQRGNDAPILQLNVEILFIEMDCFTFERTHPVFVSQLLYDRFSLIHKLPSQRPYLRYIG